MHADTLIASGFTIAYLGLMGSMLALSMPTFHPNKHILWLLLIGVLLVGSALIAGGKIAQRKTKH
jgi:hypothetical protein